VSHLKKQEYNIWMPVTLSSSAVERCTTADSGTYMHHLEGAETQVRKHQVQVMCAHDTLQQRG
jgi:hypothetical protein